MLRNMNVADLGFYLVTLVVVITIHEFCHAWMGHVLGDVTAAREGRLTLNPMAHIDPFLTLILPLGLVLLGSPVVFGAAKPVPFNPYAVRFGKWGAALVALAGPASNFVMAAFVALFVRFLPMSFMAERFLIIFVTVNIGFFVFNMIPFPPLDGSRLLYAVAPPPLADLMDRIERFGIMAVFIFIFVFFRFMSPYIGLVVGGISSWLLGVKVF